MATNNGESTSILSTAQIMSFRTIFTAALPQAPPITGREVEKRGLDIDLNLSPPEDEDDSLKLNEIENQNEHEEVMEEMQGRNRRWKALVHVTETFLREYEEQKSLTRKRNESRNESTRWKFNSAIERSEILCAGDCLVVRSTRGRAVAMPNKYRDSVIEPVADFSRVNRNDKSVASKRKSRLCR